MPPATCLPATWPAASPTRRADQPRGARPRYDGPSSRRAHPHEIPRQAGRRQGHDRARSGRSRRPSSRSDQKWKARALLAAIVLLNLGAVYMLVLINDWNRLFYDALEKRDQPVFWAQLLRFTYLAFGYIVIAVYKFYLTQLLEMRWRAWMTAPLPAALAVGPGVLPHGAGALLGQRRHAGQPGPAHPGRPEPVHHLQRLAVHGPAQCAW